MPALRMSEGLVVNPRIQGLPASSRIEARSAPSAKILTRNEVISGIAWRFQKMARACSSQNPIRGFAQRADLDERPVRTLFSVAVVDENGAATGAMAGFDVAPTVTDDVAGFKIDVPDSGGFEQQAGLRFAAGAARGVIVRAHADAVELQIAL